VFFNLFAAVESSAKVCLAHGTLCNDPSIYILLQPHRTVITNFVPGKFGLFQRNPWQSLAEPWGSTEPWLKITAVNLLFRKQCSL